MKSIIKCMNTEKFPRLRIGIGAPAGEAPMRADPRYVVGRWDCTQLKMLPFVLHFACEGLRVYLYRGVTIAAGCCNYKNCMEEYQKLYPSRTFAHFDTDDVLLEKWSVCFSPVDERIHASRDYYWEIIFHSRRETIPTHPL